MAEKLEAATCQLLKDLPAIYQEPENNRFLILLLAAFEEILLQRPKNGDRFPGLEQAIAALPSYFDPDSTPPEFLPWLAGWVGLSLRADLDIQRQRDLIAKIVPLYRLRGTAEGVRQVAELFSGVEVRVSEPQDAEFQVHHHSTIAKDTWLGGPPPHLFFVEIVLQRDVDWNADADKLAVELARSAIELAKPAHTYYSLKIRHGGGKE